MPRFFVTCPMGIEPEAAEDVSGVAGVRAEAGSGRVRFNAAWSAAYRVSYGARIAGRLFLEVGSGDAGSLAEARTIASGVDWPSLFSSDRAFGVVGARFGEHAFTRLDLGREVGDAVLASFRSSGLAAPRVRLDAPEVEVHVTLRDRDLVLGLNLSGPTLDRRSYRFRPHPAPLRPAFANALLRLAGWSASGGVLLDPLCGSGTVLIEAALAARRVPPGRFRPPGGWYAPAPGGSRHGEEDDERSARTEPTGHLFQHLRAFDAGEWARERDALDALATEARAPLVGRDRNPKHVATAVLHAGAAGVGDTVDLATADLARGGTDVAPRFVVANPPYGIRVGERAARERLYERVHERLEGFAKRGPVTAAFIVGNRRLEAAGSREPTVARDVWNGGLPCRWLRYDF